MKVLKNLDLIIAGIAMGVLVVVTFFGVVMRYCFVKPFVWQEEVQAICFVWITFMAGGAAFRAGSHVAIDVLVDLFPPKVKKVFDVLIYLAVVVVLTYLMVQSCVLIRQLYRSHRITSILHISYPLIYSAVPIGCVLMVFNYTLQTWKSLKQPLTKEGNAQ